MFYLQHNYISGIERQRILALLKSSNLAQRITSNSNNVPNSGIGCDFRVTILVTHRSHTIYLL